MGFLDTYDAKPSITGPPYGNGDVWAYYNGPWLCPICGGDNKKWVKPVGEIKVECLTFTNEQGKLHGSI